MTLGLFLAADELKALTGTERRPLQIAWLRENAWLFEVTRNGEPRVARGYFERRMVGGDRAGEIAPAAPAGHNFSAVGGRA